ncbi:9181_t:CDS:1, partial [Dentiscutata erythropus]
KPSLLSFFTERLINGYRPTIMLESRTLVVNVLGTLFSSAIESKCDGCF